MIRKLALALTRFIVLEIICCMIIWKKEYLRLVPINK